MLQYKISIQGFCKNQWLLLFNFFLVLCFQLDAQNPGHFVFDTSNGLVSDEVYDIEIATNGLIWITTDRGVQSYDGVQFTNYSITEGLLDNVNFEIYEDEGGILWFNGYNGKISYYLDGKFYAYERNDEILEFLHKSRLNWVSNVIAYDSTLIMAGEGSSSCQLFNIDETGKRLLQNFEEIELGKKKFQYFKSNNWIFSFHPIKEKKSNFLYNKLSEIKHGRSLITNEFSMLIKFENKSKVLNFDSRIDFVNNEDERIIWVGTPSGLFSIDVYQDFKISRFFEDYHITSMKRDVEGNFWVTTIESGLFLVPSFNFANLKIGKTAASNEKFLSFGLLGDYLMSGTSSGNLYAIGPDKHVNLIRKSSLGKEQIQRMYSSGENQLHSALGLLTIKNDKIEVERSSRNLLHVNYRRDYFLQIASLGLNIIGKNTDIIRSTRHFNKPISSKVSALLVEEDFFLTGAHDGLYFTSGTNFIETEEILFNNNSIGRVSNIVRDKNGDIVILTMNKGVFFLKSGRLEHLKGLENANLVNNGIFDQDVLWLGTNGGLLKFELSYANDVPEVVNRKKYNITDGLPSNYINDLHYLNNELWLATNKGICYFDPNLKDFQPEEVPLFIKYMIANDTIILDYGKNLDHDQNNIKIGYRGVSMKKGDIDPFYKFRLIKNGNSTGWKNTNLNEMQFEDLDPGQYSFEVKASNYLGEWNDESQTFDFIITPHFTDRLWFKSLAIILVLGGIISYFLWVLDRNQKRYLLRERLKQTELEARESELSLLRNQMNPHFIFNSLNSIQNLIFKKDDKKANAYLTTFGSLIRKTLDYSKKKKINLSEEIDFTIKYLELELMRFPQKFEYSIENSEGLDTNIIKVPPLLFQPIVENAIVHAFKGIDYKGKIKIELSDKADAYFEVKITDNGLGFDNRKEKKDHNSIGLSLIEERLKLINQSLGEELAGMDIITNNGTEVILNLPKQF